MITYNEAKIKYEQYTKGAVGNKSLISFEDFCKEELNVEIKDLYAFISLDVESDGLWGNPFCIAVACYNIHGEELEAHTWCLHELDKNVKNDWVKENVLPNLDFSLQTNVVRHYYSKYKDMMRGFASFWEDRKSMITVWHMGHVVEANLFKELHTLGYIQDFDAPYCPVEVSAYLKVAGYSGDSVDSYARYRNIEIPGSTHDPLYDCRVAMAVYMDLSEKLEKVNSNTIGGIQ